MLFPHHMVSPSAFNDSRHMPSINSLPHTAWAICTAITLPIAHLSRFILFSQLLFSETYRHPLHHWSSHLHLSHSRPVLIIAALKLLLSTTDVDNVDIDNDNPPSQPFPTTNSFPATTSTTTPSQSLATITVEDSFEVIDELLRRFPNVPIDDPTSASDEASVTAPAHASHSNPTAGKTLSASPGSSTPLSPSIKTISISYLRFNLYSSAIFWLEIKPSFSRLKMTARFTTCVPWIKSVTSLR